MNLIEQVNLMQKWLISLEKIKDNRRNKKIDDIDAYNKINDIIINNEEELKILNLYDVFEYAKEYYLLRIQ